MRWISGLNDSSMSVQRSLPVGMYISVGVREGIGRALHVCHSMFIDLVVRTTLVCSLYLPRYMTSGELRSL